MTRTRRVTIYRLLNPWLTTRTALLLNTYDSPLQTVVPATVHLDDSQVIVAHFAEKDLLKSSQREANVGCDERGDGRNAHEKQLKSCVHLGHRQVAGREYNIDIFFTLLMAVGRTSADGSEKSQ